MPQGGPIASETVFPCTTARNPSCLSLIPFKCSALEMSPFFRIFHATYRGDFLVYLRNMQEAVVPSAASNLHFAFQ